MSEGSPFPVDGVNESWRDVFRQRLFEQRIVVISGELDDQRANQAAVELMSLDASGDGSVHLQIDCGTGSIDAALTLMDVIELLGVPVHATGIGQIGGPGVGLLASAQYRSAMPSVRFHLFEPSASFDGHVRDVEHWVELRASQWGLFCERVARSIGRDESTVRADMDAGSYLSAEEALEYGLLHEIARPDAQIYRIGTRPMGFGRR
jgi:ATP-dependent Clp protease protease subunit